MVVTRSSEEKEAVRLFAAQLFRHDPLQAEQWAASQADGYITTELKTLGAIRAIGELSGKIALIAREYKVEPKALSIIVNGIIKEKEAKKLVRSEGGGDVIET